MTLDTDKQAVRIRAAAARDALGDVARAAAGAKLSAVFADQIVLPADAVLSGFWPSKGEIDLRPLLHDVHGRGHSCALPVVVKRGQPLVFRAWTPATELVTGAFGIPAPPPEAATVVPDVLLVPLLAFDRAGNRAGWGAGFYDRTLAALRAVRATQAIGVAFAVQEVDFVPHGPHDQPLDWIVTEAEAIRTGNGE
jgi:5-formyltetrahydrofolate cyclo-ligase